ncbi:MAG: hypothetical protein KGN34_03275 [Sphingomonadales bacterium]|nr:hypothetical protein [Sphingomonadales bacterium]
MRRPHATILPLALTALATAPAAADANLPDYALGQPLAEARQVIPIGHSAADWRLRCAGDRAAPSGLIVTPAERTAGVIRCWPMRVTAEGERRAAHPLRHARVASEELELLHGRIVRITIQREGVAAFLEVHSSRDAAVIDRLPR